MTPTLTPASRTIATVCAAVLSVPIALSFGGWVGDTVRGTDATSYSTDHVDCQPLILAEGVDYQHLTAAGYWSTQSDGLEALYAPECPRF